MVKWETHDFQKVRKQFVSVRVRLAVKNLFLSKSTTETLAGKAKTLTRRSLPQIEAIQQNWSETTPSLSVKPKLKVFTFGFSEDEIKLVNEAEASNIINGKTFWCREWIFSHQKEILNSPAKQTHRGWVEWCVGPTTPPQGFLAKTRFPNHDTHRRDE